MICSVLIEDCLNLALTFTVRMQTCKTSIAVRLHLSERQMKEVHTLTILIKLMVTSIVPISKLSKTVGRETLV
jgi:hypothetical protein